MKEFNLSYNNLTELTEEHLINLCYLKGFKPEELTYLTLHNNYLTNIDFIQSDTPFINLKELVLTGNNIKDIDNIKYLTELERIWIDGIIFNNEKLIIKLLKTMKKLKTLYCVSTFLDYPKEQLEKELFNIKEINC